MNMGKLALVPVMKAIASPGRTAWLIASPIMLIFLSTKKQPGSAQATAQRTPTITIQVSVGVQFTLRQGVQLESNAGWSGQER